MDLTPFLYWYLLVVCTVLGSVMGSFLNCTAIRLVHHESFVRGRSHCMACGHTLSPLDLVPVLSFLFLRGRCRYCGARLSVRYLLSELFGAASFALAFAVYGFSLTTLELLALSSVLLCISFADLEDYLIPDSLILAGILLRVPFVLLSQDILRTALLSLIGGLSVSVPMLLLSLVMDKLLKKESMGGGDIKLFFLVGLYLGWQESVVALLLSCVLGIAFGVLCFKRRQRSTESCDATEDVPEGAFPFGPAIALGAYLSYLFGSALISFYIGLF